MAKLSVECSLERGPAGLLQKEGKEKGKCLFRNIIGGGVLLIEDESCDLYYLKS